MSEEQKKVEEKEEPVSYEIPLLSDEDLREFVVGVLSNKYFLSYQVKNERDISLVFMPIALGAFAGWPEEALNNVGVLYSEYSKAFPRTVNGYPMFGEFRILHKKDWERASKAINRELERRKEIEV